MFGNWRDRLHLAKLAVLRIHGLDMMQRAEYFEDIDTEPGAFIDIVVRGLNNEVIMNSVDFFDKEYIVFLSNQVIGHTKMIYNLEGSFLRFE